MEEKVLFVEVGVSNGEVVEGPKEGAVECGFLGGD